MFEWHFTIRGVEDTDFAGGVYHGRILLPPEYPFKPPNIVFMTPSGRFECGVKVCLSFSAHHPELWQPAWGIRLILEAIISFLPTPADGAIGALDWTSVERKKLAKESVKFRCLTCCAKGETCADLLPKIKPRGSDDDGGVKRPPSKFHEECEKLKLLQFQNHALLEDNAKDDDEIDATEESKASEVAAVEEAQSAQPSQPVSETPLSPNASRLEVQCEGTISDSAQTPTDSQNTISEMTATVIPTTTSPDVGPPTATNIINRDDPVISDGVLHGMIGVFAIILIFLLRQTQTLMDELLDHEEGNYGK